MDIKVGKYKVFDSGVLIFSSDKQITFNIEGADFIFLFSDEKDESPSIEMIESTDKLCRLKFKNFISPLGISIKEPILIASLDNGDYLYLQYAITAVDKAVKVFQYTFYTFREHGEQD